MSNNVNKRKIAIIGGGASGMIAAIFASEKGAEVTVFEAKDTPGKKINATGNGKCNFTNLNMSDKFYRGNNPEFVKAGLEAFNEKDAIEFFKRIGIMPKYRNGYCYPNSEQAQSVSKALVLTCNERHVRFVNETISKIVSSDNVFFVNGNVFDKVIVACGSFAGMKNPEDFFGYKLAKSMGHNITKLFPALVQLKSDNKFLKTISGVRQEGTITLFADGRPISKEYGELLFSDKGVSGIPAMQISRYAAKACAEGKKVCCKIDFFPDLTEEELAKDINNRSSFKRSAEECLYGLLNYKLNYVLLLSLQIDPTASGKNLNDNSLRLAKLMKGFELKITGTNSFEMAQVVAGGVDTNEINENTMESKLVNGLYFAGEIMDVDGTCGGYNLQWAWTSGYLAGINAAND